MTEVIIHTFNTKYSNHPWAAWISQCSDGATLGSVVGENEAEVIGKVVLEFPEYFGHLEINRIPFQ